MYNSNINNNKTVELSIDKARKLYEEGITSLKELILSVYSLEEIYPYLRIKTFDDAVDALKLNKVSVNNILDMLMVASKKEALMFKVGIIAAAIKSNYIGGPSTYEYVPKVYIEKGSRQGKNSFKIEGKDLYISSMSYETVEKDNSYSISFPTSKLVEHFNKYFAKDHVELLFAHNPSFKWNRD